MGLLDETKSMIRARFVSGLLDIDDLEDLRRFVVGLAFDWRLEKKRALIAAREAESDVAKTFRQSPEQ